jgi:carboxyl-terminal processing protease
MLKRFGLKTPLMLVCSLCALWLLRAAETGPQSTQQSISAVTGTNTLVPGPNDGLIATVAARMLERNHFLHHPLDDEFSQKFFDRYIETFDPQHIHFTEGDLAEFDSYRTNLDDLTVIRRSVADLTPAYKIFGRFFERLEQRVAFADTLLKNEKFEFNDDERILLSRKDAPYPRDLDEAKQLWRQRLRFEYLQEKLGQETNKKSDSSAVKKKSSATTPDNSAKTAVATKEQKKKTGPEEIVDTLTRRYQRNLHMFTEWDNEDLLQTYINALARVYDPHSDYFNVRAADNFAIGMNLALFGIGAELYSDDGYCTIRKLVSGGPAEKSKEIKEKDRIVAVAQSNAPPVDAVEMKLDKVVQMIRGPKGTEVRLTVVSPDDSSERRIVTLIRDEIKLEDQAAKSKIIEVPVGDGKTERLGVIDLPSFYATIDLGGPRPMLAGQGAGGAVKSTPRSTSVDVAKLLTKLKQENVKGVILDLRRNGGGSLEEAVKLTGLFIKEGPVVQVSGPEGEAMIDEDPDGGSILYDGPMIVLTSRFSASASEILAGALQDYGRALIVGDVSTHGKGTVQNLNSLRAFPGLTRATNDPGALKITIRKFYRAGGASTQLKGVMPDIVLPSVLNYSKDIGEIALENPLAWDTIPSARFDKLNLVEPCLPELLQRSNERLATNQDFTYIREDIDIFKKRQADKMISLNERERLKEKEADDARQKTRDKERLARKDPDQKVYELTLKQVDLPGLPPPLEKTNTAAKAFAVSGASPAGSSPSAAVAAKTVSPASDVDGEEPEDKAPAVDPTLDEAQRILVDYIALLTEKNLLTAKR